MSIIANWRLNNDVTDALGLSNGVATDITYGNGIENLSGNFNGSTSKVAMDASVANVEGLNAGTFSCLFKCNGGAGVINTLWCLSHGSTATIDFMIIYVSGNHTTYYLDESITFATIRGGTIFLNMSIRNGLDYYSDSKWHHLVVKTGDGNNQMWVDGKSETLSFSYGAINTNEFSNINSADAMRIGNRKYNGVEALYWNGSVDEVKIYNNAQSNANIKNLYSYYKGFF